MIKSEWIEKGVSNLYKRVSYISALVVPETQQSALHLADGALCESIKADSQRLGPWLRLLRAVRAACGLHAVLLADQEFWMGFLWD